jgi:anaerobic glycerol-3-phosphate dehydrogenase
MTPTGMDTVGSGLVGRTIGMDTADSGARCAIVSVCRE